MLAKRVQDRLTPEEEKQLIAPYESASRFALPPEAFDILVTNRSIIPVRLSLMVHIQFHHPNASIAARMANLYAEEFLLYNVHVRSEGTVHAIDGLRHRAEEQRRKIEKSEMELTLFKEKHKSLSFDEATNIDQQQILLLSSE